MSAVPQRSVDRYRRQLSAFLLAGALPVPRFARSAAEPPPYAVFDFNWVDGNRARLVPARLYWPTQLSADASVPLVVFSHGIGGSRQGYSYLGKHWSSRGVACLHVQHTGSDAAVWQGNPFGVVGRLQRAAQESEAVARAVDMGFALDMLLSEESGTWRFKVDPNRLIAAGHSYGANTTLLAVGAQVVRHGQAVNWQDPRFSAAIIISAPPFYGERDLGSVLGQVAVPTVHITATDDVIEIPGYRSGAADRIAVFDAIGDRRKLLAIFRGASHSVFTDRGFTGGVSLNRSVKAATADLGLAFLDLAYRGDSGPLAQWCCTWQSILARAPGSNFPFPAHTS